MQVRMNTFLSVFLILTSTAVAQDRIDNPSRETNAPESAIRLFKTTGLDRQYEFSSHLKPSFLRGDFDGDRRPDIAILVKQKKSGKVGIAVCHSSTNKVLFLGAGTAVGNGGDNFDWMDIWSLTSKAAAARRVGKAAAALVKGDALHVEKSESASALVYWNGRRYVWRQQDD